MSVDTPRETIERAIDRTRRAGASAVDAISRMHMEQFPDSVLWKAAVDGMIDALTDQYTALFTADESGSWEDVLAGAVDAADDQVTLLDQQD